jgi:hypothetical protein
MRDGVSINCVEHVKSVVNYSEMMHLSNLPDMRYANY